MPLAEVRRLPSPDRMALERAVMDAVKALANFHPTEIHGSRGDAADAANLADDVRRVAEVADNLIHAIGKYAKWHFGFTDKELAEHFKEACWNAADDKGAWFLDQIANRLTEDARSEGGRHDFQRSLRG